MNALGHLWRAARLTLEGSRAFTAAKGAFDRGGSLPEVVRAWSSATETPSDDSLDEDLEAALTKAVVLLEGAAVWCVKAAVRVEAWAPRVAETVDKAADRLERTVPPALKAIRESSEWTRQSAPDVVQRAREAGVVAGRLAQRLREFRGGEP